MQADEATRVRLGAHAGTSPELLTSLAADPSVTVRASVALNPAAPPRIHEMLAKDTDERVRILLARKLSMLMPDLSDTLQVRLREHAFQTLAGLVADEAVRVRTAIAEEVKHLPDAPRALILRLAQDPAVMVCEPVIRFSPLLTTADLVALVATAPSSGTVAAVAKRPLLDETVADAIAATADSEAIRALLANKSAQIREATLDMLIARAESELAWHEPLVSRPLLSPQAARALSDIVTTQLLEALAARPDLDPGVTKDLQARLAARLAARAATAAMAGTEYTPQAAFAAAQAMASNGTLNEAAVLEAARRGESRLVTALLAVAAEVPVAVVERAASLRSTKGLVSLTWKAGFSMRAASALQPLLAKLGPDTILRAGPGGSFPLAPEEMRWQLDFLGRTGR